MAKRPKRARVCGVAEDDMVYFLASLAGAAGAFGGWLATGAMLAFSAATFAVPGPDGITDAFAFFGPLGALLGLTIGIALTLRLKGGVRAPIEIARRGALMLAVIASAVVGMMQLGYAALGHLGLNPKPPAVAFEIRLPQMSDATRTEAQVELHTDLNQTVARLDGEWTLSEDGRPVLRGSVPLAYRTSQRTVILNLPGQPARLFKLRLAENPSHSETFSPWHQVDFIDKGIAPERARPDEGIAIRYRVL
jgi:hypothetical protein